MKRVAIYVRAHTSECDGTSQIEVLTKFCNDNGYQIQGVYDDSGLSAHAVRPALLQLADACQHKEVDLIVFTGYDRLFRSVAAFYNFKDKIGEVEMMEVKQ